MDEYIKNVGWINFLHVERPYSSLVCTINLYCKNLHRISNILFENNMEVLENYCLLICTNKIFSCVTLLMNVRELTIFNICIFYCSSKAKWPSRRKTEPPLPSWWSIGQECLKMLKLFLKIIDSKIYIIIFYTNCCV